MDDTTEIKELLKGIADLLPTLATKDDVAEVKAEQAAMRADMAEMKAEQAAMRADIAIMRGDIEQTRREVSASHFRVVGRIDQLAEQLRVHVGGHDHQTTSGRKPAA